MKQRPNTQRIRLLMRAENNKHADIMKLQPEEAWPSQRPPNIIEVWRSKSFLAQVYQESPEHIRVSVCRTMINKHGGWEENITWEELMQIKREIGHGDSYAVEVLPKDKDIVNVANLRHFFILPAMVVGWRREPAKKEMSDTEVERILAGEPPEPCKGMDLGNGTYSGCDQTGGDCPVCGE